MTDDDIKREAEKIANATLSEDKPTLREILASDIDDLCNRVRDEAKREQREVDARKCDAIAEYHRSQPEDWWENHVICAESFAVSIRSNGEQPLLEPKGTKA